MNAECACMGPQQTFIVSLPGTHMHLTHVGSPPPTTRLCIARYAVRPTRLHTHLHPTYTDTSLRSGGLAGAQQRPEATFTGRRDRSGAKRTSKWETGSFRDPDVTANPSGLGGFTGSSPAQLHPPMARRLYSLRDFPQRACSEVGWPWAKGIRGIR